MPFEENSTNELLVNTCHLHHWLPLGSIASITDVCPAVSTNPECIHTTMMTEITSMGSHHGMNHIRSKSGSIQVDVDTNSGVKLTNMSILLILMMIFVRLY